MISNIFKVKITIKIDIDNKQATDIKVVNSKQQNKLDNKKINRIITVELQQSMTSNFLQRFKGKTTTLNKNAVNQILGSKKHTPSLQNNLISNPNKKTQSCIGQNTNKHFTDDLKNNTNKLFKQPIISNNTQNPFLVSNPFYLDQQQKQKQQLKKRQQLQLQLQSKKIQQIQNCNHDLKNQKQSAKSFTYSKSLQKKNIGNKQWVRLGGLGANIGGDQWLEKKKKQQKIQQFSGQVKSINAQRIKPPKPDIPKSKYPKQVNARQKAIQYSKNVPKPVIKKFQQQDDEQQNSNYQQKKIPQQQELTQLQIYQLKHQQLKKMINHNY